jgi:small-conductance mechanosensitive channel
VPPPVAAVVEWIVTAALSGIVGLAIGVAFIPLAQYVLASAWKLLKSAMRQRERTA